MNLAHSCIEVSSTTPPQRRNHLHLSNFHQAHRLFDAYVPGVIGRTDSLSRVPPVLGAGVGIAGAGFVGLGLWARREAGRALARERIIDENERQQPLTRASQARSLAERIRQNTLDATGGRTYAETSPYIDGDGQPTSDASAAVKDERTGSPIENPDHDLWVQSTTLQTALTQAYLAFRLSELTIALGATFVLAGFALTASTRSSPL